MHNHRVILQSYSGCGQPGDSTYSAYTSKRNGLYEQKSGSTISFSLPPRLHSFHYIRRRPTFSNGHPFEFCDNFFVLSRSSTKLARECKIENTTKTWYFFSLSLPMNHFSIEPNIPMPSMHATGRFDRIMAWGWLRLASLKWRPLPLYANAKWISRI